MKSSLLKFLQYIHTYINANAQLKRFVYESIDYQNIIGEQDDFPVLFVSLENITHNENYITYNIRFRISDLLQNDRTNLKFLHSELALAMNDLFIWLKENTTFDIQAPLNSRVITNDTTESTVTIEAFANITVNSYGDCLIPFENPADIFPDPCTPINPREYLTCEDLEYCQTIINIDETLIDLQEQINNITPFTCEDLADCEIIQTIEGDIETIEQDIINLGEEIENIAEELSEAFQDLAEQVINDKNEYFIDFRSTSSEVFTIGTTTEDIKHRSPQVTINRTANGLEITSTGNNTGWIKFNKWKWLRGSNRSIEIIVQKHLNTQYAQLGIGGVNTNEVSTSQWNGFAELAIQYRQNDIANLISNNGTPGTIQTQAVSTSIASNDFLKFRIETDGGRRSRVRVFAIDNATDWYNNLNPVLDTLGSFNMNPDESELCIWMSPITGVTQTIVAARIYEGADLSKAVSPPPALNDLTDVTITGATSGEALVFNGTDWVNLPVATSSEGTIGITLNGFGGVIQAVDYPFLYIPFNCTINNWSLIGNTTGNLEIDIWRLNGAIPTILDTIVAANYPNLNAQQINSDSTLTGWSVNLLAGDIIKFVVNSATTISSATLTLKITK